MTSTILTIVGSLLSLVAGWYIQKLIRGWLQIYYNAKDTTETTETKVEQQHQSEDAKTEDKKLEDFEDEWNKTH